MGEDWRKFRRTVKEVREEPTASPEEAPARSAGRQEQRPEGKLVTGKPVAARCQPFRPLHRPPMALLVALDDGSLKEGETWRIRKSPHTIGRVKGDTVIPHDPGMSAEHAQIIRRWHEGAYRWFLVDLNSTNGTFVRAKRALLVQGRQLLLGGRRYEFRLPESPPDNEDQLPDAEGDGGKGATRRAEPTTLEFLRQQTPRLVEITADGEGPSHVILGREALIGSDANKCSLAVSDDPFLSPVHARFFLDQKQRWHVEDLGSTNGVWIRTERTALDSNCEFQLGEQRFRFVLL